ncbi:MAG: hypothetical protein IPK07_29540 [Deltaproteobacteria bacterium]|nr:hypothetical protein [Deltaproteobacteria bacterium]
MGAAPQDGAALIRMPNGMPGIVANAPSVSDALTPPDEAAKLVELFSLRGAGLLTRRPTAPLLAINGSDDAYVPAADLDVFRAFPNATVWSVRARPTAPPEKIRARAARDRRVAARAAPR